MIEPNLAQANREWAYKKVKLIELHNPLIPKDKRRQKAGEFVKGLSDNCFQVYAMEILDGIKFTKETCAKYLNTEAEVKAFLEWMPRFASQTDMLMERSKARRQEWGLPL